MGRVAVVAGASSGIGAVTSRLLHEQGFHVYAVSRRLERMAPPAALGVETVRADVTADADPAGRRLLPDRAYDRLVAGLFTAIANAGNHERADPVRHLRTGGRPKS